MTVDEGATPFRLMNRDGTFNVDRLAARKIRLSDLYHSLLTMRWRAFLGLVIVADLGANLVFAIGYFFCGLHAIQGMDPRWSLLRFGQCYAFSVQTLGTIGYGALAPTGFFAHTLVTFEAILSLLSTGLVTGILFSRFSRPTARVVFSDVAIITRHEGTPAFLLRLGNRRLNQILEARIHLSLARMETTLEGESYRVFYDLKLERAMTPIFAMTWTVVHPITEDSPLYGMSQRDWERSDSEILVSLIGIDDAFSQSIYARYSYRGREVVWDRKFKDMISRGRDGKFLVELERIHDVEAV